MPTTISLGSLTPSQGFKITGRPNDSIGGASVRAAGDINGDGIGDLIIGAFGSGNGGAFVIYGRAGITNINLASLGASQGFMVQGSVPRLGLSVSGAGDVNGDAIADFLIGGDGTGGAGEVYVIFGKTGGYSTFSTAGLAASVGVRITGVAANDFAQIVSNAGDFNNDGRADFLIGAPANDTGGTDIGSVYVVFGKSGSFGAANLASLGTNGVRIQGAAVGDRLGFVSSAGDFNKDGIADIIVGASYNDGGGTDAGAAYIVFGRTISSGTIDLANLATANAIRIQGDVTNNYTGNSVSGAGDFNGDGFADVIVNGNSTSGADGSAYVVFGRSGGGGGTIDLTGISATNGFKIVGSGHEAAGVTVSGIGDVNGDGLDDILVGARYAGSTFSGGYAYGGTGAAYVIFGKRTGIGTVDLANLPSSDGFKLVGVGSTDQAGNLVAPAGDINNDGIKDFIVSGDANSVYVVFGTPPPNVAPAATDAIKTITEDASYTIATADFGFSDTNGNTLLAVKITTLPTAGTLTLNGGTVTLGQVILATAITANQLVYTPALNGNGTPYGGFTFQVQDNGGTANGGVDLDQSANNFTFNVTPVDDRPVAIADNGGSVAETATIASIPVLSNDTDVDGGTKMVASVNGTAITAGGAAVTIASGALVKLNLDGTLSYDPNHRYDYLVSTTKAATNAAYVAQSNDSFTYALNGGLSATVTVTVTGVDGAGDQLRGTAGNNTITGTAGNDIIDISQGGSDTVTTNGGSDGVFVGTTLDSTDRITGSIGPGIDNQIIIQGNYTATLSGPVLTNIQTLAIQSGADARWGDRSGALYSYSITLADNQNVAAGATLIVNSNTLRVGENLYFNGAAETDGAFKFYAASGNDTLIGGGGNDQFYGRLGADMMTGNGGADTFFYRAAAESVVGSRDTIMDFTAGDRIDVSYFDANTFNGAGTNDAFRFIDAAVFTGGGSAGAGELRAVNTGGATWLIEGDTDGNGVADFSLLVTAAGGHLMVASDFVL